MNSGCTTELLALLEWISSKAVKESLLVYVALGTHTVMRLVRQWYHSTSRTHTIIDAVSQIGLLWTTTSLGILPDIDTPSQAEPDSSSPDIVMRYFQCNIGPLWHLGIQPIGDSEARLVSTGAASFLGKFTVCAVLQPHDHALVRLCTILQVQSLAKCSDVQASFVARREWTPTAIFRFDSIRRIDLAGGSRIQRFQPRPD